MPKPEYSLQKTCVDYLARFVPQPPEGRDRKWYTKDEDNYIRSAWSNGDDADKIAEVLGRKKRSIQARAQKIGARRPEWWLSASLASARDAYKQIPKKSQRQKFEELYVPEPMSGCWIWVGLANPYPSFRHSGQRISGHRFSLWLNGYGDGEGKFACHKCDTPYCVNPDHLYWGDISTNARDRKERGRAPKGSDHKESKINEDIARHILHSEKSYNALSREFSVSKSLVAAIKKRKLWRHV